MATRKIRIDRLLKLADFLETVPRDAFNMSNWQTSEPSSPEGEMPGECGFAGCAVGWAAHEKMFRHFKLQVKPGHDFPIPYYKPRILRRPLRGEAAVELLFGISSNAVDDLFMPHSYARNCDGPKQVATRIREFVRDHAKSEA